MHERFYGVLYGKDQEDDFVAIERDLDNLFELGKIKPEDYNGLKQKLKNPHGRTEAMPPDELHSVWSEVTSYDVEFDEGYREAARLWSTINSVPNAQDRSLLSKLMVSRENNEPKSPYWDELDFRINADSKRDMFGQTAVKPETTVLARREVARFLMENPRDLDGATKLYEDIVANDKKTHVREEYRRKYSYGLSAEQRAMRDAGPTVLEHRRANEAAKKRGQSQYVLNGVSYEVQ
jgi:cell division protein FtsI/penicillin-binding protein 2